MTDPYPDPATDAIDPEPAPDHPEREPRRGWLGWLLSGTVHAAILAFFAYYVWQTIRIPEETPPVRIATLPPPPKEIEKPKEQRTLDKPTETTLETLENQADVPNPVTNLDLPVDTSQSEDESDNPDPKGREEAVANSETGGMGAFMAIGAGGGSSGMFGKRSGGGRKRAVGQFGGSKGSESAVETGLRWLKRHQGPDGLWTATTYQNQCQEPGPRCEPGENHRNGINEDMGLTGLAVLCFLGAGYDHKVQNPYKATVKKGIEGLLANQSEDGSFRKAYTYEQAIATMAMAEAYGMTGDPACKEAAEKGLRLLLARRSPAAKAGAWYKAAAGGYTADGLAWGDFTQTGDKMHTSACGWTVQAIKSCKGSGIEVGDAYPGAQAWLKQLWLGTCALEKKDPAKLDRYTDTTTLAYYLHADTGEASSLGAANKIHNLAGIGLVCALFLNMDKEEVMIETLANHVMANDVPKAGLGNPYYSYYATFGLFQMGGERWTTWNGTMRDRFVAAQRTDPGCFDGSWDFDEKSHYGAHVGRILSTTLAILSLEVYYRYEQVHAPGGAKPRKAGLGLH